MNAYNGGYQKVKPEENEYAADNSVHYGDYVVCHEAFEFVCDSTFYQVYGKDCYKDTNQKCYQVVRQNLFIFVYYDKKLC